MGKNVKAKTEPTKLQQIFNVVSKSNNYDAKNVRNAAAKINYEIDDTTIKLISSIQFAFKKAPLIVLPPSSIKLFIPKSRRSRKPSKSNRRREYRPNRKNRRNKPKKSSRDYKRNET